MTTTTRWIPADMPDLTGRAAIVTGANSGIGLVTAEELAAHGAQVTLAVRDVQRGRTAADQIRSRYPQAHVEVGSCDLASLASVRDFAGAWRDGHSEGLDLLINNAGVMAIPRRESPDGFEMQLATNHLGHFALTGLLFESLRDDARVVTVSSQAHRMGRMNFDDLMGQGTYSPWRAYGQSKLANLLFAGEFQRRLSAADSPVRSLAAHPGYAATNLQSVGPAMSGSRVQATLTSLANRVLAQSAQMGALPTLFAATAPGLAGGDYVGPGGFAEQRGHPKIVGMSTAARDPQAAQRLWQVSEELTEVRYP
jgi:NAD(P)-dependent dehydrogenase (short-subunit alcohol dehydrogenase family)